MEYSPRYGTVYSFGPLSSAEPIANYKDGFLFARQVTVILRNNALKDIQSIYGLPMESVSFWSQEFYFSVIKGKVALEGFRFFSVPATYNWTTEQELWQMGANDG